MKPLRLITCTILALSCLGIAQAQTEMYVTGSTAFRGNTHTAIQNIFDAGTCTFAYLDNAGGTATISNTSAAIFKGNISGVATTIESHWSGSEGGIQTVAGSPNFTVSFFDLNTPTLPAPGNKLPNGTALTNNHIPDVAMSDTFQSTSLFHGTVNGIPYQNLNKTRKTAGLPAGQIVGVVQFKFVASTSAPGGLTNMSSQNARNIFANGHIPLSMFSGALADEVFTVYAAGRDIDSGTRLTALAETGLGALSLVKQYEPLKGGSRATTCCGPFAGMWLGRASAALAEPAMSAATRAVLILLNMLVLLACDLTSKRAPCHRATDRRIGACENRRSAQCTVGRR